MAVFVEQAAVPAPGPPMPVGAHDVDGADLVPVADIGAQVVVDDRPVVVDLDKRVRPTVGLRVGGEHDGDRVVEAAVVVVNLSAFGDVPTAGGAPQLHAGAGVHARLVLGEKSLRDELAQRLGESVVSSSGALIGPGVGVDDVEAAFSDHGGVHSGIFSVVARPRWAGWTCRDAGPGGHGDGAVVGSGARPPSSMSTAASGTA